MDDEEVLDGGMKQIRRVGSTVVRPAGDHSPTVHRLLRHLRLEGFDRCPEVITLDLESGTETVSFVPGEVGAYPMPASFRTDAALRAAADLLRAMHDASVGFQHRADDRWYLPPRAPAEVICHGDFAPYNCALAESGRLGVFDFDTARPGPRLDDVGYAAYRWVPLTDPANDAGFGDVDDQTRRLALFCHRYGGVDRSAVLEAATERLEGLVQLMRERAGQGDPEFSRHINEGHDRLYLNDVEHIRSNGQRLAAP